MAWENSRPTHVPTALREARLALDGHRCTAAMRDGSRCVETTDLEADHIGGWRSGETLTVDQLQTLCAWHHQKKTQGEAARARAKARAKVRPLVPPRHPGLI